MAATTSTTTPPVDSISPEELTAKAVNKRYEGLVMVRTKAIKGKGAWYWAHLEPVLVHDIDTGLPKAVKLRCSFCDAVFSASNPSRTASEHLKRGTCPNFNSLVNPTSSVSSSQTTVASATSTQRSRKRSSSSVTVIATGGRGVLVGSGLGCSYQATPLSIVDPSRFCGDSAYSLSPGTVSGGGLLPQHQQQLVLSGGKEDSSALAMLEDSVGLPPVSRTVLAGARLDAKYKEVKAESEARIRDALFFQVASDGWKVKRFASGGCSLVNFTVNLPNGTSLYRRAVFLNGSVPSNFAEKVLWETVTGIYGNSVQQCAGIVADKFKGKALRNLENRHHWMLQVCESVELLRVPLHDIGNVNVGPVYTMIEDILNSAQALQLLLLDEKFKMLSMEDPFARKIVEMIRDAGFWNELQAVHSLVKLIKEMAQVIETERPLVGQCLPLRDDLRTKVKDWCSKFHIAEDRSGRYLSLFKCLTLEQEKDVDKLITRLVSREEAHIALMELMKWRTEGLDEVYA
ncbi:hypothetical protein V6N13_047964 [Hibiscus sabdariffa]